MRYFFFFFYFEILLLLNLIMTTTMSSSSSSSSSSSPQIVLDCNPCIDRHTYTIKAIVHGTNTDGFWLQVRDAAIQSGKDLRVNLEFDLYDKYNAQQMAEDILIAAKSKSTIYDTLIVTIPEKVVEDAIKEAVKYIPIFGLNSGYSLAADAGVLGFVAMDEYVGGKFAAKEFIESGLKNISKAAFINTQHGNTALDDRRNGFSDEFNSNNTDDEVQIGLDNNPDNNNNTTTTTTTTQKKKVQIDEIIINPFDDAEIDPLPILLKAFEGCQYDAILMAGAAPLEVVTKAYYQNGCDLSSMPLGTFDTNTRVFDAIAVGKLSFAISQQQFLQGALPVVLASLYATTGKTLSKSSESEFGIYFSGPKIINLRNLPSDTQQSCESVAFPVCQQGRGGIDTTTTATTTTQSTTTGDCPCIDRSKITIGGVLHGITTDLFWDVVFEQATQAANDLGIQLLLDRLEPQPTTEIWHAKMASKMISLCQDGVDGLFVTIPGDGVVPAIQECQSLNIPVMSVNSGAVTAKELDLIHHISQVEYPAGVAAGQKMLEVGKMKEAICLNIEAGNIATTERCQGFKDSIMSFNEDSSLSPEEEVIYLGEVVVDRDKSAIIINAIEELVGRPPGDDWDGVGILNTGASTAEDIIELKSLHPKLLAGTFDLSNTIYDGIDDDVFVFGVDQNPFMQGYIPVWLLTLLASTKQYLANTFVETGPSFIEESPSEELRQCTANHFEVCPEPEDHNKNQIDDIRPFGIALASIAIFGSLFFLGWCYTYRNNSVVRKSQPLFLGMVCVGTLLMASSIIPLSIDDSIASSQQAADRACMAAPWLFSLGFTTAFSALYSKIWRINRLMRGAKHFRRLRLRARDVLLPFSILLTLNIVFMLVWTIVDPMYWYRTEPTVTEDGLESYGTCRVGNTNVSVAMVSLLTIVFFCVVVLANYEAYKARKLRTEFSESKYVGMIMICFLQVILLGVPLIALVGKNPTASYFVKTTIVFVICVSLLVGIFVPKMLHMKKRKSKRRRNSALNNSRGREEAAADLSRDLSLKVTIYRGSQTMSEMFSKPAENGDDFVSNGAISKTQIRELAEKLNYDESELTTLLEDVGMIRAQRDIVENEMVDLSESEDGMGVSRIILESEDEMEESGRSIPQKSESAS